MIRCTLRIFTVLLFSLLGRPSSEKNDAPFEIEEANELSIEERHMCAGDAACEPRTKKMARAASKKLTVTPMFPLPSENAAFLH